MIKVTDIVYPRFRAPDLDKMEAYLLDFGMQRSARTDSALYMRGAGPDHTIHITEQGEPGFVGFAFQAASLEDLQRLAEAEGTAVAPRAEPGGGHSVVLEDPDGFQIEVVAGIDRVEELPVRARPPVNLGSVKYRLNANNRMPGGPSSVRRFGHGVLNVTDYPTSAAWYQERFGLIKSDEIFVGDESAVIGAFLRCDCGDRPVDHHTLFLVGAGTPSFNHAAFEVEDFDDLMLGHDLLETRGHQPVWGVGRHILGGQVFDYWKDPWGHTLEHWTDGDLFDASIAPNKAPVEELLGTIWGPRPPADM